MDMTKTLSYKSRLYEYMNSLKCICNYVVYHIDQLQQLLTITSTSNSSSKD
jgi:hypothetical protein